MIDISYVKFYQAVQVGKELLSFLKSDQKTKIVWEAGLLKVERSGCLKVYVPTANIMFFHEKNTEEALEPKSPKKTKAA